MRVRSFALGVVASLLLLAGAEAQSTNIDDYIEAARSTPTPTPTPAAGDSPGVDLLWIYVLMPADKATEVEEDSCRIWDEELDHSIRKGDPFVVAAESGEILYRGEFAGTTRVRAEQSHWVPGTSDEGWTTEDGSRWCRLQGTLPSIRYSPAYQIAFGEKARGPYSIPWESAVRGAGRMVLIVDLSSGEAVAEPILAAYSDLSDITAEATPVRVGPIEVDGTSMTVSADALPFFDGFTAVAITDTGQRYPLFDEQEGFSGIATIPDVGTAKSVEIEVVTDGLWTVVAW